MNTYINEYINYDKDGVIRMNGLFFIINQHSGFGRGEKAWKKVKKELEKKKYRSVLFIQTIMDMLKYLPDKLPPFKTII